MSDDEPEQGRGYAPLNLDEGQVEWLAQRKISRLDAEYQRCIDAGRAASSGARVGAGNELAWLDAGRSTGSGAGSGSGSDNGLERGGIENSVCGGEEKAGVVDGLVADDDDDDDDDDDNNNDDENDGSGMAVAVQEEEEPLSRLVDKLEVDVDAVKAAAMRMKFRAPRLPATATGAESSSIEKLVMRTPSRQQTS
eukprot:g5348.t1